MPLKFVAGNYNVFRLRFAPAPRWRTSVPQTSSLV